MVRFAEGVATLDHKTFHDAMKGGPIVKAFPGQFFEIFHCLRGHLRPKGNFHLAVNSLDYSDLGLIRGGGLSVWLCHRSLLAAMDKILNQIQEMTFW
jgi:hypothetical protein